MLAYLFSPRVIPLGFFLLFYLPVLWAGRIEVVTNGTGNDLSHYEHILKTYNSPHQVHYCNLDHLKGLKRPKTLLEKIKTRLFPIRQISLEKEVEKIIFMNVPSNVKRRFSLEKLPKEKMILMMWEPPIRLREMYNEKVFDAFSKIYTWDDTLVDNKKFFKLHYPDMRDMIDPIVSFADKKFCTMIIGATQIDPSKYPEELYTKRIEAIRYFEKHYPNDFDFYGRNWDSSSYPSYRGEIEDKANVNKHYKFSMCYENCQGKSGYITEKIFDCFKAGSVPVYWGAPNVGDYIPKNCFIDRRDFNSLEELDTFLLAMTEKEYDGYIENIQAFLKSDQAQPFSTQNFEELFYQIVSD